MPVDLSVKNVADHIAEGLRRRAGKDDRSLQGEVIAILEESVRELVLLPMMPTTCGLLGILTEG